MGDGKPDRKLPTKSKKMKNYLSVFASLSLVCMFAHVARAVEPVATKLVQSNGLAQDHFGAAVAIDNDTLIVGSPQDDIGANTQQGSVRVYRWNGSTWDLEATLTALDAATDDYFGLNVAISGDTVVIGANGKMVGSKTAAGSAYVFSRTGTVWTQQAKLSAADFASFDHFGASVAISQDTVVVGSTNDDVGTKENAGSAYIFKRTSGVWAQQAKLTASDAAAFKAFGYSVAISGDTAIVGALAGGAYVFVRTGESWAQQIKLLASDPGTDDNFGCSVAIDGEFAIVGAMSKPIGSNLLQGAAYAFQRSGTVWNQQTKLVASDGLEGEQFGTSVAISGQRAIVGAHRGKTNSILQGSAYLFDRTGGTWAERTKLIASDGASLDRFGFSVGISGNTAVVGAYGDDIQVDPAPIQADQGSAWIFADRAPCPGDLNSDGYVDDSDFVVFVSGYDTLDCADPAMPANCPADLNFDGFVDDADFVIFVGAYNALVCP